MSVLGTYQEIADITRQMLTVSQAHDWDVLLALGKTRDSLLASLPPRFPPMSTPEVLKLKKLIEDILVCHTEIADHAKPWLEHTAVFLAALDHASNLTTAPPTDPREQP